MAKRLVCVLGGLSVSVAAIFPVANRPKAQRSDDETERRKLKINEAIKQSRKLINRLKNEVGAPGIVVGVSVDGEQVWKEGLGYADIENEVEANEDTVMRIASISKSLTAAVVARLWQDGVIDIDKPVQSYVPTFPEKKFGEEKVTITTRLLMCHLSGIRHYSTKKKEESSGSGDGQLEEFYSKDRYDSVEKALAIFKDDDLLHAPGSKFLYTTYGWTLVSAVMEGATGKTYPQVMRAFLRELGMRRTYLDQPEPIIYGRSRCYSKNKNGRVVNSPYVDNSCKWAGGGFLSTVGDLLNFSNALLFAFQSDGDIEVAKGSYKMVQDSANTRNAAEIKSQRNESESVLQKISTDFGSELGSIRSVLGSIRSEASPIWKYASSWIWGGQSKSSKKNDTDKNHDSDTEVKRSESVSQKVTSDIVSGVGSKTSGVGSSLVLEDQSKSSEKAKKHNKFRDSNTTVKEKSEPVSQKVTSDIVPGVGSKTSGVGSSLVSEDQSKSSEKTNKHDKLHDPCITVEKSEPVTQKVTSDIVSGVGSSLVLEDQSESPEKANKDNKLHDSDTTVEKSETVSQKVMTAVGSGVGSVTSGVSSVWNYGSSWISGGQSESPEKANKDDKLHDSDTTVEKSETVSQKVTSDTVSGVGSSLVSEDQSESPEKANKDDKLHDSDTTVEKSETVSQKVMTAVGSGVGSVTSGVSSVWNYGSSWISGGQSESPEKANKDDKLHDSDTTVEKSETVSQKVMTAVGSGVGSVTSGVSSVWNYGSSWILGGQSESPEKANKDDKLHDSDTTVEKSETVSQTVTSDIVSGVGSSLVLEDQCESPEKANKDDKLHDSDTAVKKSDPVSQKVTSGIVSGVGSITSGVSSVWKNSSSLIWGGKSESSEKDKYHQSDTAVKKNEPVSQKATSDIVSGVGSIASGVVSAASSVWNYGSSLVGSSEKDKEKESGKSVLSSLSSLFKPKALCNDEVPVFTNGKQKEVSSIPVAPLKGKIFWNDIVIPYAVFAVKGQLSEMLASQSDEEDFEVIDDIDSPFFSETINRKPYILPTTVAKLWTRVEGTRLSDWGPHVEGGYGLGFGIASPIDSPGGVIDGGQPYIVGHTGGAVGASSAMVIVPRKCNKEEPPKGIAVVLMCNLQSVSLNPLAIEIAKLFSLV